MSLRLPISRLLAVLAAVVSLAISGCVYRLDVQQGNLLTPEDIEAVKPGMTRSQVRFLLGTPVVEDRYHDDRWDYMYYFRQGRTAETTRRWLIVYFDGDKVKEIRRDVPPELPAA
jgi:outer membrane protein assembly factor BamE